MTLQTENGNPANPEKECNPRNSVATLGCYSRTMLLILKKKATIGFMNDHSGIVVNIGWSASTALFSLPIPAELYAAFGTLKSQY